MVAPSKLPAFSNHKRQLFSLPYSYINYILENPKSPHALQKLQKCCKYFYFKFPILCVTTEIQMKNNFILWKGGSLELSKIENLWLSSSLAYFLVPRIQSLPNFYRCTISELTLTISSISMQDFEILVAENTVTKFILKNAFIFYPDTSLAPIDAILEKLPNVSHFSFCSHVEKFSAKTLEKMLKLKFWHKFQSLSLTFKKFDATFDGDLLCKFIHQNKASCGQLKIFCENDAKQMFKELMEKHNLRFEFGY